MKYICTQENLFQGLSNAAHIASKNASLPILQNVLLRAEKGSLQLAATNLEIGITQTIRGKVEEEGALTVPAKIFLDYVNLLQKDDVVTLEQDGQRLKVQSGKATTFLQCLPSEDFPLIPKLEQVATVACSATLLRDALFQVVFAAAYDDARPEISGVYIRCTKDELILAATDSYRLAEKRVAIPQGPEQEVSVIVPVRTLQELLRILEATEELVSFIIAENQILFSYGDTRLVSRLIDGRYPNYGQIIPQKHETIMKLPTDEFLRAVKAASLFSRPGIHDLTMTLEPSTGTIHLHAVNAQVGENTQELSATIEGKENSIVFNARYLLDGLANLHSDEVVFEMTNNASPGLFRNDKNGYAYIVMPINK